VSGCVSRALPVGCIGDSERTATIVSIGGSEDVYR
jgi:hypothetical protein